MMLIIQLFVCVYLLINDKDLKLHFLKLLIALSPG